MVNFTDDVHLLDFISLFTLFKAHFFRPGIKYVDVGVLLSAQS